MRAFYYGDFAEVTGSRWKLVEVSGRNLQKAGSFRRIYASFHYFDGISNFFDGRLHQLARKNISMKKIFFKIRETCEIICAHGGVLSQL